MSEFYGACGVNGCDECLPLFDSDNNQITDNNGDPIESE